MSFFFACVPQIRAGLPPPSVTRGTQYVVSAAGHGIWQTAPPKKELEKLLLSTVGDAPRPGGPAVYTAEQQCAIIGLAVRKPV